MRFEGFPRNGKDSDLEQLHDAAESEVSPDPLGDSAIQEIKSTTDVLSERIANLDRFTHPHEEVLEDVFDEKAMLNEEQAKDLHETLSRFRDKLD